MDPSTSAEAARALQVFPAGSNGEFNLPPELTTVVARGEGRNLWDGDGRRLLDLSMGWGSALLGHAHPGVTEAVLRQAPLGANFACVNRPALALAEALVEIAPAAEPCALR